MNKPPVDGIRVEAEVLRALTASIFKSVPIPDEHADLIANLVVEADLRGVVSHGVKSVERYVQSYLEGTCNPQPTIQTLNEGPATAAFSGDGGMGFIVANQAMEFAITKARDVGVGTTTTTYHDHIGSAGAYARMALREGLIAFVFSGRSAQRSYDRDSTIRGTLQGNPPATFGMPSGPDQPDFLLDMGTQFFGSSTVEESPDVFFKTIGLCHTANIMSGTLGGQMLPEFDRDNIPYSGADQSGFFLAISIERFVPHQAFTADMDHLMSEVSQLQPFPGFSKSHLPGGPEWECECDYAQNGIPVSAETINSLETIARKFGLSIPWNADT